MSIITFDKCHYSILGLGDTNFSNFNDCARTIDKRLKELGAKRATPTALADEATGLEDIVEPYVESIFTEFTNYFYNNKDELKHIEFPIPLIIMYGSATGNGEWISGDIFNKSLELIAKDDNTLFFNSVRRVTLDSYKKVLPSIKGDYSCIIVTSTTGNGDAPENASSFVRFLKKKVLKG